MEYIKAKSILSKIKNAPDSWFGISYNMNLYRGCQHQCIYCDSRSECYRIDDFSKIQIKENALELLNTELKKKKQKGTIGTGSMNDPYMPIEKEQQLVRKSLKIIDRYNFPVHIITKSNLVLRDSDILSEISKTYAAVSFTITTTNNDLSKTIEPGAPASSERFRALQELSKMGIYCGVLLMPVLPFISDQQNNITEIVKQAKGNGAQYIIGSMGMTLRDRQREYYYQKLDKHFQDLRSKYEARYGDQYGIGVPDSMALQNVFNASCKLHDVPTKMNFFKESRPEQLTLF